MNTQPLIEKNKNKALLLNNKNCPYCGLIIEKGTLSKDHVIGRKFVPKGKLNKSFNIILNTHETCNNEKSDLEDDISAITLQPNLDGLFNHNDQSAAEESVRKARNSISRFTKKNILNSDCNVDFLGHFSNGTPVNIGLSSPPYIDEDRAFNLAHMQIKAFFFMQSYDPSNQEGRFWSGDFYPLQTTSWGDWGNPIMRSFMATTRSWHCRLIGIAAEGFFKVATWRHPSADCWAWALEWNRSYRTIGFFGDRASAQSAIDNLPIPEMTTIIKDPNRTLRYRAEIPISKEDDTLFKVDQ